MLPAVDIQAGITICGTIAPPSIDSGIRIAQAAPEAVCSVLPRRGHEHHEAARTPGSRRARPAAAAATSSAARRTASPPSRSSSVCTTTIAMKQASALPPRICARVSGAMRSRTNVPVRAFAHQAEPNDIAQPMRPQITPCGNVISNGLRGPLRSRAMGVADNLQRLPLGPARPRPPADLRASRRTSSAHRGSAASRRGAAGSRAVSRQSPCRPSPSTPRVGEHLLHVCGRVLHQQAFEHAGFGLARRVDADLDFARRSVEHALRCRRRIPA